MLCKKCACENFPYEQTCWFCDNTMQDSVEASKKQEEWNKLTAELRNEVEARINTLRCNYAEHVKKLKKNLLLHTAVGAFIVLFADIITSFSGNFGLLNLFIDIATGSIAGQLLNRNKGGTYYGLFLFSVSFAISAVITGAIAGIIYFGLGIFIAAIMGYLFGNSLEIKRIDSW